MIAYRKLIIIAILMIFCRLLGAESLSGVNLAIQFHNKKIYYLNQQDLFIKITLVNNSTATFRFDIARNKFYNLDFEVVTPANILLKHADKFIIEKNSDQPAFFRELALEPGEEYGFIVELSDFVKIDYSGIYVIQALFNPVMQPANNPQPIKSNKLTVNIRPPLIMQDMQVLIETETGKLLERTPLPPDEVVTYMINARQKGQWQKFFLYLDLEKLYTNNTTRAVEYRLSTETERIFLLENYKRQLMEDKIENEILVIPDYFQIDHTEYTTTKAKVIVTEKFQYRDYLARKKYTYQLEKSDKFWLITGYIVENMGTE